MNSAKTIVIGLDCASWHVMASLLEEGKLPNLQGIIDSGVSGILRSTVPPISPAAWTSIVTGVNPEKHGVYDFYSQNRETYRVAPLNYSLLSCPTIWDIFRIYDKKIGVINFPLAFPPPEVEPFFISGITSPEKETFAYPDHLMGLLRDRDYRIHPRHGADTNNKLYLNDIRELTDIQVEVATHLMREEDWEMVLIILMGIDWVQHRLWKTEVDGTDAVSAFYQYMDQKVGRILSEAQEGWNIMVLSDHGARGIEGEVHLNSLLEEWGYVVRADLSNGFMKRAWSSISTASRKLEKRLPTTTRRLVRQFLPLKLQSDQLKLHHMIDWGRTRAFSYGHMGKIYIHRRKKYPLGLVTNEEYESLREEIIARLKSLRSPQTGKLMVGEVIRKEERYSGEELDFAPDIVFEPADFKYAISGDFHEVWFQLPQHRAADHDMEGILIMKGANIKQKVRLDAKVTDIAPTLLYLHDLPVLEDMDGHVLLESLTDDLTDARKISHEASLYSKALSKVKELDEIEQKEIEERLRYLGYL